MSSLFTTLLELEAGALTRRRILTFGISIGPSFYPPWQISTLFLYPHTFLFFHAVFAFLFEMGWATGLE
jgi:hypothetical protein